MICTRRSMLCVSAVGGVVAAALVGGAGAVVAAQPVGSPTPEGGGSGGYRGPGSDEGYNPDVPTATVIATTTPANRVIASVAGSASSSAWLPDGLFLNESGALSAETIASSFDDPDQANTFFETWGWQENSYAYYVAASGSVTAEGIVYVDIGVHRFASDAGAGPALEYFCSVRMSQLGLSELVIAPIGDQTRAAEGLTDWGTEASVYVRVGNAVIRVSVMSTGIDPMQPAVTIAQSIAGALF